MPEREFYFYFPRTTNINEWQMLHPNSHPVPAVVLYFPLLLMNLIEKLNLEIFDIWYCIKFDPIDTTLLFCIFKVFLLLFGAVLSLFNVFWILFMQFSACLIWFCAVFPQNLNFAKKLDKNCHRAEKMEFFKLSAIEIIGDSKKSSTLI